MPPLDPQSLEFHAAHVANQITVDHALGSNASDHAVVLIRVAMLDEAIAEAVRRVLIGQDRVKERLLGLDSGGESPVGTFSSRILLGAALGLFGEVTYRDLQTIRRIRNDFAHTATATTPQRKLELLSFTNNQIANRCADLKLPDLFPEKDYSKAPANADFNLDSLPKKVLSNRERFELTIRLIVALMLYIDPSDRPRIEIRRSLLP